MIPKSIFGPKSGSVPVITKLSWKMIIRSKIKVKPIHRTFTMITEYSQSGKDHKTRIFNHRFIIICDIL